MIRDKLVPALLQKYPQVDVRTGSPPDAIAIFPAKHPEVGELHIMDDGCEATIFVGEITHTHFNPYDSELSQDGIDLAVTESVLDFLEDVFADRMLLWKARNGGSGGCQSLDFDEVSKELIEKAHCYVWSGPYRSND